MMHTGGGVVGVVSNMFLRLFEVTKFNEGLVLG